MLSCLVKEDEECRGDMRLMIDKLIEEGEQAKKHTSEGYTGQYISGETFYKWIYKCALYFEKHHPNSFVTKEIKNAGTPNTWNNNDIHAQIMGALRAFRDMTENDKANKENRK